MEKDNVFTYEPKMRENLELIMDIMRYDCNYVVYKDKQISNLEAKLEEKDREINYVYPFLKEYDNGVFTEYNVVYERDGIVATTCFGKNKEMAYEYLKTLRNDIKVVSQNQKAIEQLEKVKRLLNCDYRLQETNYTYTEDYYVCLDIINEYIDNQINELKGKVEDVKD